MELIIKPMDIHEAQDSCKNDCGSQCADCSLCSPILGH
jgi:hypothetical protein